MKAPLVYGFGTHRFKLGITLPFSGLYAVLSLMAFGVMPFTVAVAMATVAFPIGALYLADYMAKKLIDG